MSKHVTIDVEARFVDNMSGEAKAAASRTQRELDKIEKDKVKPVIDIDNNKFLKKIRDSEAQMRKLGRMEGAMVLKAIDKASTVIAKVLNAGRSFGNKVWNAYLKVRDSEALASLRNVGRMGREFAGKTWRASVKIVDYATAPLRGIKNMLFSIQSLVMAITAGLAAKQFIVNPIGLADAYSGAQIGFSTLLGESRGQKMMDDLDVFAKATPFNSSEVIAQSQKMLAMGWDADKIIEDMTIIGDAAAATGKGEEGLQRIVLALAQIKSKGKLSTEELVIMMIYWLGSRGDSCEETHENNCVNAMEKRCA